MAEERCFKEHNRSFPTVALHEALLVCTPIHIRGEAPTEGKRHLEQELLVHVVVRQYHGASSESLGHSPVLRVRIEDFGPGILSRNLDGLGELGPYLLHVIHDERSGVERCDRWETPEAVQLFSPTIAGPTTGHDELLKGTQRAGLAHRTTQQSCSRIAHRRTE